MSLPAITLFTTQYWRSADLLPYVNAMCLLQSLQCLLRVLHADEGRAQQDAMRYTVEDHRSVMAAQSDGLVVMLAVYGNLSSLERHVTDATNPSASKPYWLDLGPEARLSGLPEGVIDVTGPIQLMCGFRTASSDEASGHDGGGSGAGLAAGSNSLPTSAAAQLIIPPGTKSELEGFWDPCDGYPKQLLVRYAFHGAIHQVVIDDEAKLRCPQHRHWVQFAPVPIIAARQPGRSSSSRTPTPGSGLATPPVLSPSGRYSGMRSPGVRRTGLSEYSSPQLNTANVTIRSPSGTAPKGTRLMSPSTQRKPVAPTGNENRLFSPAKSQMTQKQMRKKLKQTIAASSTAVASSTTSSASTSAPGPVVAGAVPQQQQQQQPTTDPGTAMQQQHQEPSVAFCSAPTTSGHSIAASTFITVAVGIGGAAAAAAWWWRWHAASPSSAWRQHFNRDWASMDWRAALRAVLLPINGSSRTTA